jgi:hypothetical protein
MKYLKKIEIPILQNFDFSNKEINQDRKASKKSIANPSLSVGLSSDNLGVKLDSNASLSSKKESTNYYETADNFSRVFLQVFQIKETILKIKEILTSLDIRHLVIMLDDFSEIEEDSIKTFVDVILAPLNNWSDEFIKFKIAAYPNRVYYGKIDPGKVDTINLDFYKSLF